MEEVKIIVDYDGILFAVMSNGDTLPLKADKSGLIYIDYTAQEER